MSGWPFDLEPCYISYSCTLCWPARRAGIRIYACAYRERMTVDKTTSTQRKMGSKKNAKFGSVFGPQNFKGYGKPDENGKSVQQCPITVQHFVAIGGRVAVGPGNAHFISIRQVSSYAVTLRRGTYGTAAWPATAAAVLIY